MRAMDFYWSMMGEVELEDDIKIEFEIEGMKVVEGLRYDVMGAVMVLRGIVGMAEGMGMGKYREHFRAAWESGLMHLVLAEGGGG